MPKFFDIATALAKFIWRYISGEWKAPSIFGCLLLVWMAMFFFKSGFAVDWVLAVYCVLLLLFYSSVIFTMSRYVHVHDKELLFQDVLFILIYCVIWILIVFLFAIGWNVFGNFGLPSTCFPGMPKMPYMIDALYFSSVAFSTVGFGDFVPCNPAGKLFLSFQVFVSSIHLVTFFSLLLNKRR